jgi:hypothetical protein
MMRTASSWITSTMWANSKGFAKKNDFGAPLPVTVYKREIYEKIDN